MRTYDVPTGQLVDAFRTTSISTSLTFSPTGDFLATAQVDSVGVFLWANKAQFSEVALRHIDEDDITNVSMPSVHGTDDDAGGCSCINRDVVNMLIFIARYRSRRHHPGRRARIPGHLHHTGSDRGGNDDPVLGAEIEMADPAQLGYHPGKWSGIRQSNED